MDIVLIAAMDRDHVIGNAGKIPWLRKLPRDLTRFKELTMGHPVVMGRKTHESIGRLLPGRANIIMSRNKAFAPKGTIVLPSRKAVLDFAKRHFPDKALMVIGGAEIYRLFLPLATRLEITVVGATFGGDAHFPEISPDDWTPRSWDYWEKNARNAFDCTFVTYFRNKPVRA